jgi:membrane associated rhomboid family serine protease
MFLPLRAEVPRVRVPLVTLGLLLVCAIVYAYEQSLGPQQLVHFARRTGVVPWEIAHFRDLVTDVHPRDVVPPPLTIFTSMFVHGDVLHLLGNMWFLWLFGSRLEPLVGRARFLGVFFGCGLVAAILQVLASPSSTLPMIGASGAIAGILGAYALHFPRTEVRCLLFLLFFATLVRLPSRMLLGLWLLAQVVSAGGHTAGVAWYAHIGGFLAGLGLAYVVIVPPRGIPIGYGGARDVIPDGTIVVPSTAEVGRGGPVPGLLGPRPPLPTA